MPWVPAIVLGAGVLASNALVGRRVDAVPLRAPIESVARTILDRPGKDLTISEDEQRVAGMTSFVLRAFDIRPGQRPVSVYVGYYDDQRQGKTIHSPKNCLPGAGWEPVGQGPMTMTAADGRSFTVNRYHLVKEGDVALVYYWYQGRGRVAHDEFRVKLELLRDAAMHGRTEEALVRIVIPVTGSELESADELARRIAPVLEREVDAILPVL